MSETVLWTNSSVTSAFAGKVVTLSGNISDYDYIAIEYRQTTVNAATNKYFISSSNLVNSLIGASGIGHPNLSLGGTHGTSTNITYMVRPIGYQSDTSIQIGGCLIADQGDTTTLNNNGLIPIRVVGIK